MNGRCLLALVVMAGCAKKSPCPAGQVPGGTRHALISALEGREVERSRGCVLPLADGGVLLEGAWAFFNTDGEKIAGGLYRNGTLGPDQRADEIPGLGREGEWLMEPGHTATWSSGFRDGPER